MHHSEDLVPAGGTGLGGLVRLVTDTVRSPHSKRAYEAALSEFLLWCAAKREPVLSKAVVQQYRAELEISGRAPASINVRLSAIRRFAVEAADNGVLAPEIAAAIGRVKGVRMAGVRTGNWLSREQAEQLLCAPDDVTAKGRRDRVILAFLIGCGLRRQELAGLCFEQVQQRDGRWVLADLVGKGGRVRTVPVPVWAKAALDVWADELGSSTGLVLRRIDKRGRISLRSITAQSLFKIVKNYADAAGLNIAPHDLRRTYAKLARKGGAALEQIQLSLGHSSLITTERYLGVRQNLADGPCDHLGLNVGTNFLQDWSHARGPTAAQKGLDRTL